MGRGSNLFRVQELWGHQRRQSVFDCYESRPRIVFFDSFRKSAKWMVLSKCTVPTGLRMCCLRQPHPTLKRGANNHCAYGAGWKGWGTELLVEAGPVHS